jgi:hypothetical protein
MLAGKQEMIFMQYNVALLSILTTVGLFVSPWKPTQPAIAHLFNSSPQPLLTSELALQPYLGHPEETVEE